ncbi:MAG: hypothetical protein M0C28_26625 [Candidatus Moduliflexus flocculans]|nr:hypothetical protein [Candidatus Moduliflexus flocculans]
MAVAYGAGTLREKPGQEGLAYLLENLMFQGSGERRAPAARRLRPEGRRRAQRDDRPTTRPCSTRPCPSNQLALALWLESDRMKSLAITPAAIERTRTELIEAHRGRLASDPYFASFAEFDSAPLPRRTLRPPPHRDGRAT